MVFIMYTCLYSPGIYIFAMSFQNVMRVIDSILYTFLIAGTLFFSACDEKKERTPDFYTEIRSADKLILSEMRITKMATVRDRDFEHAATVGERTRALLNSMKVGSRVAVYSYDTYLQAYIDLSELTPADVVVDDRNRTVTLRLPQIQTELAGRDGVLREEHYRVSGFRSEITPQERAVLKERMNARLRDEVESGQFRTLLANSATDKAVDYFTALIAGSGYRAIVEFTPIQGNHEGEGKF